MHKFTIYIILLYIWQIYTYMNIMMLYISESYMYIHSYIHIFGICCYIIGTCLVHLRYFVGTLLVHFWYMCGTFVSEIVAFCCAHMQNGPCGSNKPLSRFRGHCKIYVHDIRVYTHTCIYILVYIRIVLMAQD